MMLRGAIITIAVRIFVAAAASVTMPGMLPETVTGSYQILVEDEPAGVERFEQTADGQRLVIKSVAEVTGGGQKEQITATTELIGSRPVRYEVETIAGGRSQKYSLQFEAGVARAVIEAYGRRSERDIVVDRDVVILDKNIWHHYALLISRYDLKRRGAQLFPVITPQSGLRGYLAEVEFKGNTTFRKVRANRFVVLLGEGYEAEVIADGSNRLLSIEVSALDTKAVLQF
jgi:hypothetical protein